MRCSRWRRASSGAPTGATSRLPPRLPCCLTRAMWAAGVSDNIKPLVHLSDFLMGIAAACAYDLLQRRARPPKGWWLYLPGLAGAAGVIAYPGVLPDSIDMNTALRPLNGLLLIGLALGGGAVARVLSTRVAVYLGKSSYAMYILHVPILWWCLRRSPEFPPLLYVAIVIAVSAVVYGAFEEPANRRLRQFPARPSSAARACIALTQNAMCSFERTPSSCAPSMMSWRLTLRAKALSFIFFFTDATSTSNTLRVGLT